MVFWFSALSPLNVAAATQQRHDDQNHEPPHRRPPPFHRARSEDPRSGTPAPTTLPPYQFGMLCGMETTQIAVRLPSELLDEVDRIVQTEAAASRADAVRQALDLWVRAAKRRRTGEAIVAGYDRMPPVRPDDWGDLNAALDWATAAVMSDLERQEREAGLEPW